MLHKYDSETENLKDRKKDKLVTLSQFGIQFDELSTKSGSFASCSTLSITIHLDAILK